MCRAFRVLAPDWPGWPAIGPVIPHPNSPGLAAVRQVAVSQVGQPHRALPGGPAPPARSRPAGLAEACTWTNVRGCGRIDSRARSGQSVDLRSVATRRAPKRARHGSTSQQAPPYRRAVGSRTRADRDYELRLAQVDSAACGRRCGRHARKAKDVGAWRHVLQCALSQRARTCAGTRCGDWRSCRLCLRERDPQSKEREQERCGYTDRVRRHDRSGARVRHARSRIRFDGLGVSLRRRGGPAPRASRSRDGSSRWAATRSPWATPSAWGRRVKPLGSWNSWSPRSRPINSRCTCTTLGAPRWRTSSSA